MQTLSKYLIIQHQISSHRVDGKKESQIISIIGKGLNKQLKSKFARVYSFKLILPIFCPKSCNIASTQLAPWNIY